jgi:LmbE family N-acetylglucosaminyl deacetylase
MNPYLRFVSEYARLARDGKSCPLGGFAPAPRPVLPPDAPRVLIFSPHPDDECVIGGLALRLLREARMHVLNVAVTQGSRKERQAARFEELKAACSFLGFGLVQTAPGGLERISIKTRERDAPHWRSCVQVIAKILALQQPKIVFFPHDADWNSTHVGTHHLVVDALKCQPQEFSCCVVETEFWGAMATPNLMVESRAEDVADLMAATSFHVGEVRRNPYHLLLPAWMQDNVRRGGELVSGQGGAAPDFTFSTLYRLRRWRQGGFHSALEGGRQLSAQDNPAALFT